MVYTYEMWDDDGRELAIGLYETDSRPEDVVSAGDQMPVRVRGDVYVLDSDDLLLKAHSFFRKKYDQPAADDCYIRWASIITFCRENAVPLANENIVQIKEGEMAGIDANFVRMLLDSYQSSPIQGGFPISELTRGRPDSTSPSASTPGSTVSASTGGILIPPSSGRRIRECPRRDTRNSYRSSGGTMDLKVRQRATL